MNAISPVGAPASTPPAPTKSSVGALDYSAFLKLLIAQLKNQDPSEPMDSTAFVAQLATFSQVEQSINSNSKLDALLAASGLAMANGLIGRTATSADGSVSGIVVSVKITANGPVATLGDGNVLPLSAGIEVS